MEYACVPYTLPNFSPLKRPPDLKLELGLKVLRFRQFWTHEPLHPQPN